MKRRVAIWLTLCLALCLALVAWGRWAGAGESAAPGAPAPSPSGRADHVLAFFGSSTEPWDKAARAAASDWCAREGWELVEYDCLGLAATQALQVADLARNGGADLAVLCAVAGQESLEENAQALKAQGGTVMSLADSPLEAPAGVKGHLAPYSEQVLEVAAAFFRRELEPGAGVVLLHDVETAPLEAAAPAALEGAGVPVAAATYTWGSVDYAQTFLGEVLNSQSGLGGVLCFSPTGALGAQAALGEAGLTDGVKVLCLDGAREVLDGLEGYGLAGAVTLAEEDLAQALPDALDRAARGETLGRAPLAVEVRRGEQ